MKKNLLICTFLFLIFFPANYLKANGNRFRSTFENINGRVNYNNKLDYLFDYYDSFSIEARTTFDMIKNNEYDRKKNNLSQSLKIKHSNDVFYNGLIFDYIRFEDEASPHQTNYEYRNIIRKAGYEMIFDYIRNFDITSSIYYVKEDELQQSDIEEDKNEETYGYENENKIMYKKKFHNHIPSISFYFNKKDLKNDWKRELGNLIKWNYLRKNFSVKSRISYNDLTRKTYLTNTDEQNTKNLKARLEMESILWDKLKVSFEENISNKKNEYKKDTDKNYSIIENEIKFKLDFPFKDRFFLNLSGENLKQEREFENSSNSNLTKFRKFSGLFAYHISEKDSFEFSKTISLRKIYDLNENLNQDNDRLKQKYRFSLYLFPKRFIRLVSHFIHKNEKHIFIDKDMSSNNKTKKSYILQPEVDLLFNQNLIFKQEYQLKAEYDNNHYSSNSSDDILFRRISYNYNLVYYNGGIPNHQSYGMWRHLRKRSRIKNPFLLELSFGMNSSETGRQSNLNIYEIFSENKYHTFFVNFMKYYRTLIIQTRPKVLWSDKREYSVLLSIEKYLGRNSFLDLDIKPTWNKPGDLKFDFDFSEFPFFDWKGGLSNINWRIELTIDYYF